MHRAKLGDRDGPCVRGQKPHPLGASSSAGWSPIIPIDCTRFGPARLGPAESLDGGSLVRVVRLYIRAAVYILVCLVRNTVGALCAPCGAAHRERNCGGRGIDHQNEGDGQLGSTRKGWREGRREGDSETGPTRTRAATRT